MAPSQSTYEYPEPLIQLCDEAANWQMVHHEKWQERERREKLA